MNEDEIKVLQEELDHFQQEKDKIRAIIGTIGGKSRARKDRFLNIFFITLIVILFALDTLRHLLHFNIPLPPLFSIEIGLMLVSIKIIWMIHKQMKVEHFQFWILNTIEFRINEIHRRLTELEKKLSSDR
jgi:hypothetical protein